MVVIPIFIVDLLLVLPIDVSIELVNFVCRDVCYFTILCLFSIDFLMEYNGFL